MNIVEAKGSAARNTHRVGIFGFPFLAGIVYLFAPATTITHWLLLLAFWMLSYGIATRLLPKPITHHLMRNPVGFELKTWYEGDRHTTGLAELAGYRFCRETVEEYATLFEEQCCALSHILCRIGTSKLFKIEDDFILDRTSIARNIVAIMETIATVRHEQVQAELWLLEDDNAPDVLLERLGLTQHEEEIAERKTSQRQQEVLLEQAHYLKETLCEDPLDVILKVLYLAASETVRMCGGKTVDKEYLANVTGQLYYDNN